MKIYLDKNLTEEIVASNLDLGIGLAGESHEYTFYVYNELHAELRDLNFKIKPQTSENISEELAKKLAKEVKVLEAPSRMKYKEIAELKLQWNPAVNVQSGLKAKVQVDYFELWS